MSTPIVLQPGDTFWGLDRQHHLWIALTPLAPDGSIFVANFTSHHPSEKASCDERCTVVNPGEHPYPRRPSCIFYEGIRTETQQDIMEGIERPFRRGEPLSPALLRRVRQGALDSDRVARAIKDAVRAALGQGAP